MIIEKVLISNDLIDFLEKRNLWKQYKKVKQFLLDWHFKSAKFKIREPKKDRNFYFRINKQYRAFCKFEWGTLKVFDIYNHQK